MHKQQKPLKQRLPNVGAENGTRTRDPNLGKAGALPTELRPHIGILIFFEDFSSVGLSGLEPPTSRLSGVRSNRLSYKPMG